MSTDVIRDRIATIASEAFGPFPVQTVEEDLTAIEQGISKLERERDAWQAAGQQVVDLFSPTATRATEPEFVVMIAKAARSVHLGVRNERDEARTKLEDFRSLAGELLESLRLASTTSDGHRDAHAAYQRWAAKHAPDAIGDEQKREAIETRLTTAEGRLQEIDKCRATLRQIDEQRMLLNGEPDGEPASRPPLDPAHAALVANETARQIATWISSWGEFTAPEVEVEIAEQILAGRWRASGAVPDARPALDPAHRETFERMLRREQDAARRLRAQSDDPECPAIDDEGEARLAALTAALGGVP